MEAAKIHGLQSCQRMQNTLKESTEKESEGGMFEKAKEKMKMQLQELKHEGAPVLARPHRVRCCIHTEQKDRPQRAYDPNIRRDNRTTKQLFGSSTIPHQLLDSGAPPSADERGRGTAVAGLEKNYVVTKLKKDVSIMLKLALSHQEGLTERLPDFQDEYREIDQIHKMLQGM
ncbi:unnamed protein product [Lepidochelys olivacea]